MKTTAIGGGRKLERCWGDDRVGKAMEIPRIIHQCAPACAAQQPAIAANIERLRRLNPGWHYCFWDDADSDAFVHRHFAREIRAAYDAIDPEYGAARADLFRYLVVYRQGGVYLDIKASMERPLDTIIAPTDEYVVAQWDRQAFARFGRWPRYGVDRELQQWHVMSRAEHPLLKRVIDRVAFNVEHYHPLRNGIGRMAVLLNTGPIAYSRAVLPDLGNHRHTHYSSHADLGLVYSIARFGRSERERLFGADYRRIRAPLTRRYRRGGAAALTARVAYEMRLLRPEEPSALAVQTSQRLHSRRR
jgi:hypothetical protein